MSTLQVIVGFALTWAAIAKFRDLETFRRAVRNFAVVPVVLVRPVSRLVPAAEFVLGMLVLAGVQLRVTAGIAGFLLIAFTIGIAVNLRRGHRVSCACFGASSTPIGMGVLVRNGCLTLAVATIAAVGSDPPPATMEVVAAVVVGVIVLQIWSLVTLALRVGKLAGVLEANRP